MLRETLQNGISLKDRLGIKLEHDMRYGEVRLDHWLLHTKVTMNGDLFSKFVCKKLFSKHLFHISYGVKLKTIFFC